MNEKQTMSISLFILPPVLLGRKGREMHLDRIVHVYAHRWCSNAVLPAYFPGFAGNTWKSGSILSGTMAQTLLPTWKYVTLKVVEVRLAKFTFSTLIFPFGTLHEAGSMLSARRPHRCLINHRKTYTVIPPNGTRFCLAHFPLLAIWS